MLFIGALPLTWSVIRQQESTLTIRAVNQGASMPDGFSIWHHLGASGIRLKSITPQNDALLITFDSSAQNTTVRVVLDRTLPHGSVTAQQDNNNQVVQWLSRLREALRRFGQFPGIRIRSLTLVISPLSAYD